jgi:muconolactone delta-isomerase
MNQYMVEMELPPILDERFMSLIPSQRAKVNELMNNGRITTYTVALDRSKVWLTVTARGETEVVEMLTKLPLTTYMEYEIHELMFHQSVQLVMPNVSLN